MKQTVGFSQQGNLKEAVRTLNQPQLLILITEKENFVRHVKELEECFPGVPSIGGAGQSYAGNNTVEHGVMVIGYSEQIDISTGVLEQLSLMPLNYIKRLENGMNAVQADSKNTVCIDICTGNDSCLVTTLSSVLQKKQISLVGGTVDTYISCNGIVYEDACAFAFIKNRNGKVKAYKENIYTALDYRFTVTKSDTKNCEIKMLNGKPAAKVYQESLEIPDSKINTQTFQNPFGRRCGSEVYIISIKEVVKGQSLVCYKRVNESDVLTLLQLADYKEIVANTVRSIQKDFSKVSAVLSINCLFRFLLFQEESYWNRYLEEMGRAGNHAGFIGLGEHWNTQHANQTMSCAVFE